jgi:hypothetical protein
VALAKRVSLRDSILAYGGLTRPRRHAAFRGGLELRRKLALELTDYPPVNEDELTRYINEKFAAERRVLALIRTDKLDLSYYDNHTQAYVSVPIEHLDIMEFEFEESWARLPGGNLFTGLVVAPPAAKGKAGRPSFDTEIISAYTTLEAANDPVLEQTLKPIADKIRAHIARGRIPRKGPSDKTIRRAIAKHKNSSK